MCMKNRAAWMKRASKTGVHYQEVHLQKELEVGQIK